MRRAVIMKKGPIKKLSLRKVVGKKPINKIAAIKKLAPKRRQKNVVGRTPILERLKNNPIISPNSVHSWESKATFNPGAFYNDGKVHLIYRAIGDNDVSVLGYASSENGVDIDERLMYPVYFKGKYAVENSVAFKIPYSSGGGWNGGYEDPRLTLIDNNVYLIYTAFDGWGSLRMAMTKISLSDFLRKRWNWGTPVYISRPGEINKNWVLFPEKVNGKFAILHSINPKIAIDYFESLDELGRDKYIDSSYGSIGEKTKTEERWDDWVRGAGPPPIRTKYGWLLLYHAMSSGDPNRYKLGAMTLDIKDPTRILYRSKYPLLEPDKFYENDGFKAGVVYSCGAVVMDGQLFVYYGGADTVTAVAVADLNNFLEELIKDKVPTLRRVKK